MNTLMQALAVMVGGLLVAVAQPAAAGEVPSGLDGLLETKSMTEWTECTVDSTRDVGTHLDVAVLDGVPYVSYYDQANDNLWFARQVGSGGNCGPGNSWACQVIDSGGDVGDHNSIAVRQAGLEVEVLIAYHDTTNRAFDYAAGFCDSLGCTFAIHTIATGISGISSQGLHTSVAYDSSGTPYIAYQMTMVLADESAKVAHFVVDGNGNCGSGSVAGYWQCDTISSSPGLATSTSIAFDGLDRPQIAFYDPEFGYPRHAVRVGAGGNCGPSNTWWCSQAHINGFDMGASISVLAEADGTPHLAFGDATNEDLVYATFVGANGNCGWSGASLQFEWQCDVIDDDIGPVGSSRTVDVAADASGAPMIAYRDASSSMGPAVLRFAQPYAVAPPGSVPNCGPYVPPFYTWVCTTLDNGGAYVHEGAAVAISADSSGVAIAYHEEDWFNLRGNLKAMLLPLPLFADGFETGSTNGWSSVVP